MPNIRKASVAGKFYPAEKETIKKQIDEILKKELPKIKLDLASKILIGGIVPHAGYMFSAYEAVHFFEIVKQSQQVFDTVVIINPNHSGLGRDMAFDSNDMWETPIGKVQVDNEFGNSLGISVSDIEQRYEHSAEVMIPMLQLFLNYPFKIAPITMMNQSQKYARNLAGKILKAAVQLNRKILVIASSDFSHYVSPEYGKKQDLYVIEQILAQNTEALEQVVHDKKISVCGYGPIMTLIEYAKLVTEKPAVDILRVGNSGEVIASSEVVDYVSVLFSHY